jgi:transcriptional regulator with XRE-family HTH domain
MRSSSEAKDLATFGKNVAQVRRSRHLTQEELAEKAGITALTVGYIEQGRQWPKLSTLKRIAKCLNVTPAELLKGV